MYDADKVDMVSSKDVKFVRKAYKMTDSGKVNGKVVLTPEAYDAIMHGGSDFHRWWSQTLL